MVKTYVGAVSKTPQSEAVPGRQMVENAAGGYAFEVDDFTRLRRFLILGTEGGTYYAGERKHTLDNVECLLRCIAADGPRAVDEIVQVSTNNLAPKNDAAVFALAVASVKGDEKTRRLALGELNHVCRTGTHLFQFAEARQAVGGGWGRGARRAIASWYLDRPVEKLVHQLLKYRQRGGWSHRDLLRLAHPARKAVDDPKEATDRELVFDAACAPDGGQRTGPSRKPTEADGKVWGAGLAPVRVTPMRAEGGGWKKVAEFSKLAAGYMFVNAQMEKVEAGAKVSSVIHDVANAVADFKLERELVPTLFLSAPEVQEAMLPHLGYTALIRNLGNMGRSGLLKPLSAAEKVVVDRITNLGAIVKSRVHPFQLLIAARTYSAGRGVLGRGEPWEVAPRVVDALDDAFVTAFRNVEPTGKRHLLGIDVSGSMSSPVSGTAVPASAAAAAMALVTMRTEPESYAFGFNTRFVDLKITPKTTLVDLLRRTENQTFGGTDCAVAIRHAAQNKLAVDAFVVYSDGETWAGDQHACAALVEYRKKMGIDARLVAVNFTAVGYAITDPTDRGSMNLVGLDASVPAALAAFVRGEV